MNREKRRGRVSTHVISSKAKMEEKRDAINVTTNTVTTRISQCSIIALFSPPPVNNTVVESDVSTITEPVSQSPAPESTKSPTDNNLKPAVWGEDTEPTEDEEVEEETPGFTAIIAFTAVLTAVFLNKRIIKPR